MEWMQGEWTGRGRRVSSSHDLRLLVPGEQWAWPSAAGSGGHRPSRRRRWKGRKGRSATQCLEGLELTRGGGGGKEGGTGGEARK